MKRVRRWACALFAGGTLGSAALVAGWSGSAAAADTRYQLSARGDAFYFEVNGDELPASPRNDAGSLTAAAQTSNAGGSTGFAGMPYWGNTVQTLPGTFNGVPNQFGAPQLQLPFAVLPGYVASSSTGTADARHDFGYGRIASASAPTSATSTASFGAPDSMQSPNQQQTADAATRSTGGTVTAVASGSSSGFVTGPLEVANSTAVASISQTVGSAARVQSQSFGRFSVAGQQFGFDQSGFRYLGQGSGRDALSQADAVLKGAGVQLDLVPVQTGTDSAGQTTYTIGGLKVTTTQTSPDGSGGTFTLTYILGRAQVVAGVQNLAAAPARTNPIGVGPLAPPAAPAVPHLPVAPDAPPVSAGSAPVVAPAADLPVAAVSQELPMRLGYVHHIGQTGQGSRWLFGMLLLAGACVLVGHVLFGHAAAAAKGWRR